MRRKMTLFILICICVAGTSNPAYAIDDAHASKVTSSDKPIPGSDELPIQYLGPGWARDRHLMYSPGVQNFQISRAVIMLSKPPIVFSRERLEFKKNAHSCIKNGFWYVIYVNPDSLYKVVHLECDLAV